MNAVLAIMQKDILQWTRRPLYFISSVMLAILIISAVGNTVAGANDMPFGLYDPDRVSELAQQLQNSKKFRVLIYDDPDRARSDLARGNIVALAEIEPGMLEDKVRIVTDGYNPLVDYQISMGLLKGLTQRSGQLHLPLESSTLFKVDFNLRDYVTPGLAAYLCYVLACMNLGFSWIYEWMERTYRQIVLAPNGLRSAIIAKTSIVTIEASVVLWLALCLTSRLVGFTLGHNFLGIVWVTLLSMFCFTCLGLLVACFLRTIRIYTMTISIAGVALMFVSGVVVPVEGMPGWEQWFARAFPMYYSSDAFKGVMLGTPADYSHDCLVLLVWAVAALTIAINVLKKQQAKL